MGHRRLEPPARRRQPPVRLSGLRKALWRPCKGLRLPMTSDGERAMWTLMDWQRLPKPTTEYRFAPPRRWRFDFAWPEGRLALEVEGGSFVAGRHTRGTPFEARAQ